MTGEAGLHRSPAVARNRDAILTVLREELQGVDNVLEIGSGTGEHAVYFAPRLDWLTWQTSDRPDYHAGINAWIDARPAGNLRRPLILDVNRVPELAERFGAVFSANTAHIMSAAEVERMIAFVGSQLADDGRFCLYGPFNRNGGFTSESNARFDASLRAQDPAMGIRDLEWLDQLAEAEGMSRRRLHAMPANNFLCVWHRA